MSRLLLTADSDWELENPAQDVRGFSAVDSVGRPVGTVVALVIDTAAELVSTVVLDSGAEVPVLDVAIGDRIVYLAGAIPGAATVPDVPHAVRADFRTHHDASPTEAGFDAVAAAYRFGFHAGLDEAHTDADAALRAAWPGADEAQRTAAHYGYERARHAATT